MNHNIQFLVTFLVTPKQGSSIGIYSVYCPIDLEGEGFSFLYITYIVIVLLIQSFRPRFLLTKKMTKLFTQVIFIKNRDTRSPPYLLL